MTTEHDAAKLVHLALVAAGVAHRLCLRGEDHARNAVSGLEEEIEVQARSMGVYLDDGALAAVRDGVNERLGGPESTVALPETPGRGGPT